MTYKEKNLEIMQNNQNNLRDLEQFYSENKVDNILDKLEEKKKEICSEIQLYAEEHKKPCEWNKDGEPIRFSINLNPLVINNYFFKSIVPLGSIEPVYNAEKLALAFDYYCYILSEVNDKIGNFPSSLTSFCKLCGITLSTLRGYKNSSDLNMRIITEKIYDQIGDNNITMSQLGITKERTTMFRLKSENEMAEKEQPKVNINIVDKPDMELIQEKLNKYKIFANKKGGK